jgi:hypothetical protein
MLGTLRCSLISVFLWSSLVYAMRDHRNLICAALNLYFFVLESNFCFHMRTAFDVILCKLS